MSEEVAASLEALAEHTEQAGEEGQTKTEEPAKAEEESPKESDAEKTDASAAEGGSGKPESPVKQKPKEEEKPQRSDPEEPQDDVPIVLVTGASGYLGSHVVKLLLEEGRFHVRGTVRNLDNEKKLQHLRDLVSEPAYPLRLIEADLLKPKTWTEAVRRCQYVFHVASPLVGGKSKSPDALIKPAVEGTTSVLKACAEAGTVKRVVLTSSTVAVTTPAGDPDKPADHVYTEADFCNEARSSPYEKGKVRAEKAAWELVKGLEADKQFELVTMCPGLLQGPVFGHAHNEGSATFIGNILSGKLSRLPDVCFPLGDVRDVAQAHLAALRKPEAAGNRYICFTEVMPLKAMAQILAEEFKPQGYKIGLKSMPKAAMWAAKFVSSQAKTMYQKLGKKVNFSNEKMKGELGIEPRSPKDTLIDTAYSLVDHGIVVKKPGYLGHPSTRPPPPPQEEAAAEGDGEPQEQQEPANSEPAKTEDPAAAEKPPIVVDEPPPSAPETAEEAPPSQEPTKVSSEPTKVEEPPKEEPTKAEEPPSEEPKKAEEPPSEEPTKAEEPQSEEATKAEEPPSQPTTVEEASEEPPKAEDATSEEPPSEPPKEEEPQPSEPVATQEPETQEEPVTQEEPSAKEMTQEEEPPSEPAQGKDPPAEPTNEEPAATEPAVAEEQEEQKESEPQDAPPAADETANDADTES
jgi:nucleoside-diphosphate-sugar epimerase